MALELSAPPRLAWPMAGAYIFLADNPEPTDPSKYYDYIPPAWSNIDFTTVDVLYVGPGGVQYEDGRFGLYDSEKKDSLATKQIGSLATRFSWVVENARKQNPNIKIMISQWPNSEGEQADGRYWGFDWSKLIGQTPVITDSNITNYADSVKAFVKEWDIDGYDIDYEPQNIMERAPDILSSIRTKLDALSKDSDGRPFYVTACANDNTYLAKAVPSLSIVNMMTYPYGGSITSLFTSLGMTVDQLTRGFCAELDSGCDAKLSPAIEAFNKEKLAGIFQWRLNSPEYMKTGYAEEKEFQRQIYDAIHPPTEGKGDEKEQNL